SLTVSEFGTYVFRWVEMNGSCGDSVTISINFLDVTLARAGDDALICGTTYRLNAEAPTSGFGTWSYIGPGTASFTNLSDPSAIVSVDSTGVYTFIWSVNNSVCQSNDDVTITFRTLPVLTVSSDTTICAGTSVMLRATGDGSFLWSPADRLNDRYSRSPIATPTGTTTFSVSLTNEEGCVSTETVTVTVQSPPDPHAGSDQVLDYVFNTTLEASPLLDGETGRWIAAGGSTADFLNPTNPYTPVYNLSVGSNTLMWEVDNHVCPAVSDVVVVTVNDLLIPTLITPNNDGRNDFFVLKGMETLGNVELIVFDRNGHELYKNNHYDNDWDGKDRNGKDLPEDTYFVVIKADNGVSVSSYVVIRR
ncbi:MAG: gliding motility-associated C-terminal domain-containing protein, partial [Bacteroidales bacterium]|nr:gliding motility-associated C-terminal domain-containing protein [Bacteroidales bacterium]